MYMADDIVPLNF